MLVLELQVQLRAAEHVEEVVKFEQKVHTPKELQTQPADGQLAWVKVAQETQVLKLQEHPMAPVHKACVE